ncbi:MAG: amino acid adenylation domain-containing protein [Thermoanaerobaculia bacterium]
MARPRQPGEAPPLSFAQERLWFIDQLQPGSPAYNIPLAVRLRGRLDVRAFHRGLGEVVRRHETLRTRFAIRGGRAVQAIDPELAVTMPVVDLQGVPGPAREHLVEALAEAERHRPFDLATGPLLRATLLRSITREGKEEHVALLTLHHIVSDGWSMGVLVQEIAELYRAFVTGTASSLPELPIQYADFAVWQREQLSGEALEAQLGYWRRQLAGLPALLELPTDRPYPALQTFRGGGWWSTLSGPQTRRLMELCHEAGATLFMGLLAAFQSLLHLYARQDDLAVGSPVAGRSRRETEPLIGFFVNSLVLRGSFAGNPGFRRLLRETREVVLGAFRHQDTPFEKLVEELVGRRDLSHSPLFQAMLVLQNTSREALELPGVTLSPVATEGTIAKFDLTLNVQERGEVSSLFWSFNRDLFDGSTIERMAGHFDALLSGFLADPERGVRDLAVLSPEERHQLLAWSTSGESEPPVLFHEMLEEQARRVPDRPAVISPAGSLTYSELNARANGLAHRLRRLGVGPEARVGLLMDRSLEMVTGLFGILKAGGAYVPLDPAYPEDRVAWVLADAGISLLLTQAHLLDRVPEGVEGLVLDDSPAAEAPWSGVAADNLAYVIYTSGSTGRPKGALVPHRTLSNLAAAFARIFQVDEESRILQFASLSFDASVGEILLAVWKGAALCLAPKSALLPGAELVELLRRWEISHVMLPPSVANTLPSRDFPALRTLAVAGEACAPEVAESWAGGPLFLNIYGPTETTVCTTVGVHAPGSGRLSLGTPLSGVTVYVVDANLDLTPRGVPGELCIGGAQVGRGYLGRPDLTAERFVPDPFSAEPGARLYHSGDLVRFRADGTLDFLGRIDQQVKIRGFRIELGEVESALLRHPAVAEAVVLARQDGGAERRLVAYLLLREEAAVDWRGYLARWLPDYMVPSAFVILPDLPRTTSGKVDRRALPAPSLRDEGEEGFAAPRTPLEIFLADLWKEALRIDAVGLHDDFFALGGSSITGALLVNQLQERLAAVVPVVALFEAPTVALLADGLRERCREAVARLFGPAEVGGWSPEEPGSGAALAAIEPGGWREGEPLPLSFAQERLWFFEQMEPGTAVYHVSTAFRLSGPLDAAALDASLAEVVRRHASLRTTFQPAGGRPVQLISAWSGFPLPVLDLGGLPAEGREAEAQSLARGLARRPFDLRHGPLLRAALIRLEAEEHVAVFVMHHIVSDGWSMGVLTAEVTALYGAFSQGLPSPLPELPIQYPDYALWQRSWLRDERLEGEVSFWKETLAGAPVLELPTDRPRPPRPSFRGGREPFALPADLTRSLAGLGRAGGATPFMVLLAGLAALLSRYSGQEDLSIGSPVANRSRAQTEPLVGFLVNTLVLRADLSGGAGFRELLARVRRTALAAYAHQELPFERVVEEVNPQRHLGLSPFFQVLLLVQDGPRQAMDLPGLRLSRMSLDGDRVLFDLSFSFAETPGGMLGMVEHSYDLFDPATAARMAGHLGTLLAGAVADPERRLTELPLLTENEVRQLAAWSHAEGAPWVDRCLHEMIEARVDLAPEALAVIGDGEALTYGELEARSNRLAHRLRRLGVGPEVRVGLCTERSLQGVAGILGILKAGGVYVPVDPSYPQERRSWILADAGARVLLTQESLRHGLPVGPEVEILCLDTGWKEIAEESAARPEPWARPENLAYAIYTSGSTGTPKGVEVEHRAVAAYVGPAVASYGYGEAGERVLQTASWGFDASIEEVLVSLIAGVAVVLWDGDLDAGELLRRSVGLGVTALTLTPAFLQLWTREVAGKGAPDLPVKLVITGGEALSPEVARLWPSTPLRHARLVNDYGPTEAVIVATDWVVPSGEQATALTIVPIGRPRPGRSAHVVDPQGQPVPVGVPGELLLGGSLARGYLGRPEATAERFVPDPFSGQRGARLYRTGDRARWLPSGELEFLGRVDHQVKIRGFRIELGEIEAVLASHPGVAHTAVTVRPDGLGGQHLVAYVVPAGEAAPAVGELRDHLATRLPGYMVPAVFAVLEELPLTAHGKVDRKALPAPDAAALASTAVFVPPRIPTEEKLAAIWAGLLSTGRVGLYDDFFQLGGHSLLATRLVSRIREAFGVELPLRRIFERPGLAAMAEEIEAAAGGEAAPPLLPVPRDGDLPLSFAQERLWFLDQLQPGSPAYNMPAAVRLRGRLDARAFHRSLEEIVRRHESLRTRFAVRGGRPVQVIAPEPRLEMPVVDLRALPAGRREATVRLLATAERLRPFHLGTGPLIRATLLRLGKEEHAALLTLHHIVADGWSVNVLIHELATLYAAFAAGGPSPLPALPIQYPDFAVWQREWLRGEVLETQLAYWRQRLAGYSILQLPTDRPRPAVQRFNGAAERLVFGREVSLAFLDLGRRQELTPYMTLLAGFQALLHRYSGQDDVIVGGTVAGRDRGELEPLIGFFINTLVMRSDLSGRPAFRELLARVRETALGALSHQHLPFEKLVEELAPARDLSRPPLFQVVFQLQGAGLGLGSESLELPGLELSAVEAGGQSAKFDIVLNLRETAHGVMGSWSYNTDLFDRATLARMSRHFESLLAGAVADPDRRVAELPLLSEAERHQLGLEWGSAPGESLSGPCLHEIFAARAMASPEAVAASCEGSSLSYGELDRRANHLAWHLIGLGVSPGDLVGLCLERSLDTVVAILGVLKAGAAYVPLDPAYPTERLAFMLEDSRVPVLLTQQSLAESLPGTARRVFLDRISGESEEAPDVKVSADHPAYVIYTSGSTGRPKGVVVRHGNVTRLFTATDPWFGFGAEDVWTLFHSYAFDFSVWEIWGALLYGGRLVVVPYWMSRSPEAFYELLVQERVTVLNQTPSAFRQLIWAERSAPDLALRYVIFGGEALEPASLAPWLERHGDQKPRLINMYGITETTVHVTWRPIGWKEARGSGSVIGRAIPDLGLYVLDADSQPQPVGVPGEIHVGGAGLALGYLGRPELTAERFVPNPWGEPGSRLYRSGDLARFLANGDLEYLGRTDHQVKIRGFRIELGEIESAIAAQPAVREAVVLAREEGAEKRLVAYVVPDGEAPTLPELRAALAAGLPDYMLPSALMVLDRMPLTGNGKVDRRALPAPGSARADLGDSYVAPATDLERFLAGLWQEVLGLPRVGALESFFELGGSSITGAVLVSRLQEKLQEIVHVVVIFDAPTVAEMAAYLIEQHPAAVAGLFGPDAAGGRGLDGTAEPAGEAEMAAFRSLIQPLPPRTRVSPRNPPAVFVLSPPRSGSTLLRVMLGGHPRLFAPPELELLSFNTLRERRAAFTGRDAFWLEGAVRAVMEIRGCGAAEAEALIEEHEREDLTALEFYGRMQEWLGGRILVDKTPSYALDPAILRRAEEGFEEPFYIHLIRHPLGMIHSFEEAKLDQIFFRRDHPFSRRQLAELIWRASHENIVEFLRGVPVGRQRWVRFEDLLRDPEAVLRGLCDLLGLDYHPDMAEPYLRKSARMTDGVHAESRMLGDVKFHQHAGVEAGVAERWRERYTLDSLHDGTRDLAGELGYEAARPASPIPAVLVGLQPEGSKPPLFLVHPLSGELLLYRQLAAALGPNQPVYGFQALGFASDAEPLDTLEEMAATYVQALLSFQPRGPYLLAGSSLGGVVAFEMARQLRSQGREAAFVGLLDSPDPAMLSRNEEDGEAEAEAVILGYLTQGNPPFSREHLRGLAPAERLDLLLQVGHEMGALAPAFGARELARLVRVVGANRRALRSYEPQPCRANLVYLRAAGSAEADDARVWAGLALGGAEIHEVPGGHLSMHFPPHVETLAARLGRCIEGALEAVEETDREA